MWHVNIITVTSSSLYVTGINVHANVRDYLYDEVLSHKLMRASRSTTNYRFSYVVAYVKEALRNGPR